MSVVWKFIGDNWWWLITLASAGGAEWVAGRFDAGITAASRRRARSIRHREELRGLDLEAKKRQLEAAYPQPVRPICGCSHDLAFHNVETNACHHVDGDKQCTCQHYTGPEPLGQVYLPPLADPERGTA